MAGIPKWAWWVGGGVLGAMAMGAYGITYVNGKATGRIALERVDGVLMSKTVAAQWRAMKAAAAKVGINLTVNSGFRTMAEQLQLWNLWMEKKALQAKVAAGLATASDKARLKALSTVYTAAYPGHSNHQSGRALDINVGRSFTSAIYKWLAANAPAYGFTNTEGSSIGEPHHWVYQGALA